MAKLLSYFNLCPIMDSRDFLGVAEGKEEGTIINTLGRNIVIIIKLNSQKQMKSWATIEKLNTKVVYDRQSDRYVGGFGTYLKCWAETIEDLKKVKKTKTPKPIQDILTVNECTVVVFKDGSCALLSSILSNGQNPSSYTWNGPLTAGCSIVKVETATEEADTYLTLTVEDSKKERSVLYYKIPSADEEAIMSPHVGIIHLQRKDVQLLNSCVVQCNSGLAVLSIWSDKRMMRQEISDDISESDSGQFLDMINFVKLDQPFAMASPSKNYIAVYGGNANKDGASLMLYNIQYNIVEAKQNFKVLFGNSRLWILGANILLASGQSLSVFPFHVAEEELLHLVGSMKNVSATELPAVQNDMIDEGGEDQSLLEFRQDMKPGYAQKSRQKPIATQEEFAEIVDTVASLPDVRLYGDAAAKKVAITVNEDPLERLSLPVRTLVQLLEGQGFSEMEITNELVPHLLAQDSTADLMALLGKYTTLSEGVLVEGVKKGIQTANRPLLARLIAVAFEEEYLTSSLRKKLAIEEVLFFVEFLYECLSGSCQCADVDDMDLGEIVIKWLTCLIDAHYTNILMSKSKELAKKFNKWRVLIEKHIEGLQQLAAFSAMVDRMAQAKPVTVSTSSKWYSIQVVRI